MNHICKCRVCEKELKIKGKKMGRKVKLGFGKVTTIMDSDEGILFRPYMYCAGIWFCNSCWEEIIKYCKEKKVI